MELVNKIFASFKKGGVRGLLTSTCNYLSNCLSKQNAMQSEQPLERRNLFVEFTKHLKFVCDLPNTSRIQQNSIEKNTINWLVPVFENSSGGHLTIFRLINDLENLGFKNRIIFESKIPGKTAEDIQVQISASFLSLNVPISFGLELAQPAYFTFATNWSTAYMLKNFADTVEKCYLIQDYEPYFYALGSQYYLAENTYDFGFKTFTGGTWLADQLKAKHNVDATAFSFGCDHTLYHPPVSNLAHDKKTLLFYARPSTPRRGFELAMLAFEKLLSRIDNVQIILAGCDLSAYELPKNMTSVGIVPMNSLPQLYRDCDAGLILSFTNISLLPLDLMASGCAVVSNSGPQVEWLINEDIAMLSKPDPDSLAFTLEKILTDDNLRQMKIDKALGFVANCHWQEAARLIADNLKQISRHHLSEQSLVH